MNATAQSKNIKAPHLLRAGANVRKLKENLVNVVDSAAILAIEAEICNNVAQLYSLGKGHYDFAVRQPNRHWRQKVSRLYYAAFNVSRAVRLCVLGEYSTDSSDHKKVETLPEDFPNKHTYTNRLGVLRDDRNLCDYGHTVKLGDLVVGLDDANELVTKFLNDANNYLKQRGVKL